MISGFAPVLLIMLAAWVWLAGARAREFATVIVRHHCDRRHLQLLDETVALARMGIRWTDEGLRIRRMYRFEFSLEGVGRRTGFILMLGTRLENIDDGLEPTGTAEPTEAPAPDETTDKPTENVVPFRRRDK